MTVLWSLPPLFADIRHGAAAQASMEMQSVSRWGANSFWA